MKKKTFQYLCALLLLSVIWYATPTSAADTEAAPSPDTGSTKVKTVALGDGVEMEFVYVGSGKFEMGSNSSDSDNDEQPVHAVYITKSFWMGRYEVTLGEYRKFLQSSGNIDGIDWSHKRCPFKKKPGYPLSNNKYGKHERQPVVSVSWHGAVEFCEWLTEKERDAERLTPGYEYRLPTEAEWEYAARGGQQAQTDYKYAGANNIGKVAWHDKNSGRMSHRVGKLDPNELGLYDMSGNVWEWCLDCYDDDFYQRTEGAKDPVNNVKGGRRVLRGGGCFFPAKFSRSANRSRRVSSHTGSNIGFRIVLAPSISQ